MYNTYTFLSLKSKSVIHTFLWCNVVLKCGEIVDFECLSWRLRHWKQEWTYPRPLALFFTLHVKLWSILDKYLTPNFLGRVSMLSSLKFSVFLPLFGENFSLSCNEDTKSTQVQNSLFSYLILNCKLFNTKIYRLMFIS